MMPEDILRLIAAAMLDSLENGQCDIRAGCSREDAAAVLLVAFESCTKSFNRTFAFDSQPEPIHALARIL